MSWQDDFVVVKNETEKDIEWGGRKYAAGSQSTVPFLNMSNSFGDPRSTPGGHQVYRGANGETGVIQPRETERQKVQTYWGTDTGHSWDDIPDLTFYTMDGDRLYTVRDDPGGEHVAPASITVDQQQALQKTVQRQQDIINRLLEVSGLDKDALPPEVPTDIPTDESTASDTQSPWAHAEASE